MPLIGNFKSSVLPLAMWNDVPPEHLITSIIYLEKSNLLVTGSESGHIIIWSSKPYTNQLVPIHYLISHRSKVISFGLAGSRRHTDVDYFVSFSKDGELGLWEASDGRSVEFVSNASFDVQSVYSYESENVKQRLLFCCLKSPEIVILNSMSLSEVCTLICLNSPNLFSSVTAFNISTKDDVILASTVSGMTSMWVLNFADVNNDTVFNPKFNSDESLKVDLSDPIKITHNPFHTNIILIIAAYKFMVYHAKNWNILCYKNCCRGDYFVNGKFISTNCLLMHCQSGKSLYYKLPPRSDFKDPLFGETSTNLCDNIPKLLCQFMEPMKLTILRHRVITKVFEHGFVIWKGFPDGTICRWEYKTDAVEVHPQLFSLSTSWKNMKKHPPYLAQLFEGPEICGPVTSLLYLTDLSLFVLGMHNGSIFISNFETSIGNVFKKTPQTQAQFIKLSGHCGAVLCLLHPCSTMKLPNRLISCTNVKMKSCLQLLKLTYILWSGGEDYTIRVWDIKTRQCLNIFQCHSAPVVLLRLNHLPENSMNICGFSQGFTAAMFNSVNDEDANSGEIRQMINICMNAFMVSISEDDGISIIGMMKRKLLLYSVEHDSPVKNLGWMLESGYLLLETINNTVYVWDLSNRSMDRIETGELGQAIMGNCSVTSKLRSRGSRNVLTGTDMITRHSLSNLTSYNSLSSTTSNKFLKFQFIKTGSSKSFTPVIIFDLTLLLNTLDSSTHIATNLYSLLCEIDNPLLQGLRNSDTVSNFDCLMMDVTAVNRDVDIKILIIKIILSRIHIQNMKSPLDSVMFKFLDTKADMVACSFGLVNSKTGCITFNIKDLFKDESKENIPTIENILIQLSISNKITNPSNQNRIESCVNTAGNFDFNGELSIPRLHSSTISSYNFSDYNSSNKLTKLLLAYRTSILDTHIPMLLKKTGKKNKFSDCPENMSVFTMEKLFNSIIFGILDVCDWISTSAYQILVKVISDLSYQEIQNFLLVLRTIILPDLNRYTTEGGRSFAEKNQVYIGRFSEQSFLASDWIWWYSSTFIKIDQDKRNLSKLQIKALVYLALIGTYLHSDDYLKSKDDVKLFSKIFSLDNYFLARTTCDFLLNLLITDIATIKRTKNRLISLAMMCLSNGFTVWEPYLNSSTLIYQLFEFTEENDEDEEDCCLLSSLAKQSLRCIALTRPLVFIMVCYREMLRLQNGHPMYGTLTNSVHTTASKSSMQRMQSSPAFITSYDTDLTRNQTHTSVLKKNILFPILEELCEARSEYIGELLPEVVELYLNYNAKFNQRDIDIQHLLYPVLKFSSVSIHTSSGHICVGSSNGSIVLFDAKIGKYFTHSAHKKAIKLTQFSNDAKHLATYSLDEGVMKIWQISHTGLFHIGSTSYNVKMVLSQTLPSVDEMIQLMKNDNSNNDTIDSYSTKKKKSLKKTASKIERPSYIISDESGLGLNWNTDNKTLSITFNGFMLQKFKV